jgi:cobalt-zinc-cadmium resistance protein CzcA
MLDRIIEKSLKNRLWIFVLFGIAALAGLYFLKEIPIDAVPDITSVQVVVNTKTGALDPEQVEKTVSYPVESEMSGISGVHEVRSLSKYGLSQVVIVFKDGTNIYWARQQISERLQNVRENLPQGLSPELAPITTGLGEVLMYVVLPKADSDLAKKSLQERLVYLRTIQDLVIKRHLKANVPNIAEVDSNGGYKKEIHIDVDPRRLDQYGLSIEELVHKLETLGESFGGGYIEHKGKQIIVRTLGSVTTLDQIRERTIKVDVGGRLIPLEKVAHVREDFVQRLGAATYDGEETVLGTVLMLSGANSRQVALDSEKALREMDLPNDVEVKPLYSRRFLVEATIKTVAKNLAEGAGLVIVILLLILGNFRAAIMVSLAIPLSMLFAATGMRNFGISANLMSLGAIDFGLLVDASVVIIENVLRQMEEKRSELGKKERYSLVLDSVKEVAVPVTLGLLLIMAVYVPILALEGIEGKIFKPMAQTVLMALGSSLLVALLLMPAMAFLVLRKPKDHGKGSRIFTFCRNAYEPLLKWSIHHRTAILIPVGIVSILALFSYFRLGAEFMPPLDEGDMVVNLTRDSSISLSESINLQKQSEKVIASFNEVEFVFARLGTPESATDPMGVHLADTFIVLKKDRKHWGKTKGGQIRNKDDLFKAMREAIEEKVPGQEVTQSQPIEMRFNEILEGSRADVSLRIYGKDLEVLLGLLEKSRDLIEKIPGASEVELDALTALRKSPVMNVRLNDKMIARYGVEIGEVNSILESAMGGKQVGSFYEYQWRFPIVVRLTEEYRDNPQELANLPVGLPEKGTVPLSTLATLEEKEQVTTIAHQHGVRYAAVAINLAGRDTASFVAEAKQKLAENLKLPEGYTLSWGGQFKNLEQARARLKIIVPLILVAIFFVLLKNFGSVRQAILIYTSIPFAVTGGIFSLYIRGIHFSISAAVGFIALIGIAILNAMVLVTFFNQLREKNVPLEEAVTQGALARLRPVLMTALVASLGFLPMAFNTGMGAEVQRPLATVVIGGLLTSTALTLLVVPTLYLWIERHAHKKKDSGGIEI